MIDARQGGLGGDGQAAGVAAPPLGPPAEPSAPHPPACPPASPFASATSAGDVQRAGSDTRGAPVPLAAADGAQARAGSRPVSSRPASPALTRPRTAGGSRPGSAASLHSLGGSSTHGSDGGLPPGEPRAASRLAGLRASTHVAGVAGAASEAGSQSSMTLESVLSQVGAVTVVPEPPACWVLVCRRGVQPHCQVQAQLPARLPASPCVHGAPFLRHHMPQKPRRCSQQHHLLQLHMTAEGPSECRTLMPGVDWVEHGLGDLDLQPQCG